MGVDTMREGGLKLVGTVGVIIVLSILLVVIVIRRDEMCLEDLGLQAARLIALFKGVMALEGWCTSEDWNVLLI